MKTLSETEYIKYAQTLSDIYNTIYFPLCPCSSRKNNDCVILSLLLKRKIKIKNGIYVFSLTEGKIVRHLNEGNLLSNDEIGGIVRDSEGNFWIKQYFTPTICIDPRTFEVIEYSPEWMRLMNGDNNYAGPIHINDDGKVFTDGIGGFFAYHPDDLKIETEPPKVVLNELKVNNETTYSNYLGTASLEAIGFSHEENSLEIGLKSITPEMSQHTQYAYRLLGNSFWTKCCERIFTYIIQIRLIIVT